MSNVIKLGHKFSHKYGQNSPTSQETAPIDKMTGKILQRGTDPKKHLINAVGYIVPNGPEIKKLQTALNSNGAKLMVDGVWGPLTYEALIKYQKDNNFEASGRLNPKTVEGLSLL